MIQEITSRANPLIKEVLALHQAKERKAQQRFIAQGLRVCKTLIDQGYIPVYLFATDAHRSDAYLMAPEECVIMVTDQVMEKISTTTSASGILGVFSIPPAPNPAHLGTGIVLAQVSDPGNMGTIIRTAAAMGAQSVVVVEGCDPWHPKVIQSTAGALASVSLYQWSWQELIAYKKDIPLCALVVKEGNPAHTMPLAEMLLVVGSEAHGIATPWADQCTYKATLSMPGNAESLNAAVAASIALYLAYGMRS